MKTKTALLIFLFFSITNAQWTQINSPTQNNLNCVQVISPAITFIGGNGGKVYKTINGGKNWVDVSPQSSVDWYSMSFTDENHGWVGGRFGTVARTVNGGASWEINSVYSSTFLNIIESMYFNDHNLGYITGGIYSGTRTAYIYKTTNGGQTWDQQSLLFGIVFLEMSFVTENIGYVVGTNGAVYKTTNGGNNWNECFVTTGFWLRSVFFTDAQNGVVMGQSGSAWKTTNGGDNWNSINSSASDWIESVCFIDNNNGWAVGGGGLGIYTGDGGNSWASSPFPTNDYLCGVHFKDSTGIVVGNNGTIFGRLTYGNNFYSSITVTDSDPFTGMTQLFFGQDLSATDSIDAHLLEEELPPLPPSGIFDARLLLPVGNFSSLRDYRNLDKRYLKWRMQFQGTPPFHFDWDFLSLPAGNFHLKDLIGGSLVNIDMKSQGSYTLPLSLPLNQLIIEHSISACYSFNVSSGWNIVSLPLSPPDSLTLSIFPTSVSEAFGFNNGYYVANKLEPRKAYWLKFNDNQSAEVCGSTVEDTIHIKAGWNMVGGLDEDIAKTRITTTPAGIIAGNFFGSMQDILLPIR